MRLQALKQLLTPLNIVAASLLIIFTFSFAVPGSVSAVSRCSGLTGTDRGACLSDPDGYFESQDDSVLEIIPLVINIFSIVVGVIAVIMIIVGGLKYITSSGDSGNVTSAKNTILYAVIGLVIVALAQVIVRFVLGEVGGDSDD